MYPIDSDLHLVALSPELQLQQNNNTVKINIQHHPQQAVKTPARCDYAEIQQKPPAARGEDHTNSIPSRHSGGGITLHSEPHQRQHLTSKGNADYRFPNPLYRPYVDTAYKYASI